MNKAGATSIILMKSNGVDMKQKPMMLYEVVCPTCSKDYDDCLCWLEEDSDTPDDMNEPDSGVVSDRVSLNAEDVFSNFSQQFRNHKQWSNL